MWAVALTALLGSGFQAPLVTQLGPEQTAQLQSELDAARREIVQLRAQLSEQAPKAEALSLCEQKNARLYKISNDLLSATDRKYRHKQIGPVQLGRRKFEQILQDVADRVYENRTDATVPRTIPQSDSSTKSATDTKQKQE
jgi:hypothetical protein